MRSATAHSWRIRLAVIAGGVVLALLIGEGALRARDAALGKDRPHFVADTTLGWRPLPNVTFNYVTSLGTVEHRQNSHGMGGPDRDFEKPDRTFRILVLGDSFTQALEVPYMDRSMTKLEQALSQTSDLAIEVVNAGVQGYGLDQEVLYYETEGWRYRPDLVLVMKWVGDVGRVLAATEIGGGGFANDKPRFHLDGDRLALDPAPQGDPVRSLKSRLYGASALYRLVSDSWYLFTHPVGRNDPKDRAIYRTVGQGPDVDAAWALNDALVARLSEDVSANGSRLLIAIQPEEIASDMGEWNAFVDTYHLDVREWDRREPDRRLMSICERRRIECLDLLAPMSTVGRAAYIPLDGHYTPLGHQTVADELGAWLRRLGLAPSR